MAIELKKDELTECFEKSQIWLRSVRRTSGNNTNLMLQPEREKKLGKYIFDNFMPPWFKNWFNRQDWRYEFLLGGEDYWWLVIDIHHLTKKDFWQEIS